MINFICIFASITSVSGFLLAIDTWSIILFVNYLAQVVPNAFPSIHPSDQDTMTVTALEAVDLSSSKNDASLTKTMER